MGNAYRSKPLLLSNMSLSKWVDPEHYSKPYFGLVIRFKSKDGAKKFLSEHKDILFDIKEVWFKETVYIITKVLKEEFEKINFFSLLSDPSFMKMIINKVF